MMMMMDDVGSCWTCLYIEIVQKCCIYRVAQKVSHYHESSLNRI